jgi:hypothetical protein
VRDKLSYVQQLHFWWYLRIFSLCMIFWPSLPFEGHYLLEVINHTLLKLYQMHVEGCGRHSRCTTKFLSSSSYIPMWLQPITVLMASRKESLVPFVDLLSVSLQEVPTLLARSTQTKKSLPEVLMPIFIPRTLNLPGRGTHAKECQLQKSICLPLSMGISNTHANIIYSYYVEFTSGTHAN